jgi:hypothetical protein
MSRTSRWLTRLAEEILPQVRMTFERKEGKDRGLNSLCFELQKFVSTVRSNEELKTSFSRIDDEDGMVLMVGMSEHEEREAIARAIRKQARKLAKKEGLKVDFGSDGEDEEE